MTAIVKQISIKSGSDVFDTKAATAREQFAALDLCDAADDISYLPFIVAQALCKTLMGDS